MAFAQHKLAFPLAALLALTACGGGGSDDDRVLEPSDEPPIKQPDEEKADVRLFSNGDLSAESSLEGQIPVGVYKYSGGIESSDGAGLAIIGHSGRIALAFEGSLEFARLEVNEDGRFEQKLESTYTGQDDIERLIRGRRDMGTSDEALARIAGSVIEAETGALIVNYRLDRQQPDDRDLTTSTAASTYSGIGEDGIVTAFSLGEDGTLIGSDSTGCDFAGEYIIPDPKKDVFEASFAAEKCGPTRELEPGDRDGDYFAVGRINLESGSLTMFGTNGEIGMRLTATDAEPEEEEVPEKPASFFDEDFDAIPSVVATLEAGTYDFTEIALDTEQMELESGILMVSDTGRAVLATDVRQAVARAEVSDVNTFRAALTQSTTPGTTQAISMATEIFGIPDSSASAGSFKLTGSLLDPEQKLLHRYSAERDTTNDSVFAGTPLDTATLSGTYSGTRDPGAITATLTIAADGTVSGADTTGCVFDGLAKITAADAGIFEVRTTLSNCTASTNANGEQRDGEYSSVGAFTPGSPDAIKVVLGSNDNVELLELERQ